MWRLTKAMGWPWTENREEEELVWKGKTARVRPQLPLGGCGDGGLGGHREGCRQLSHADRQLSQREPRLQIQITREYLMGIGLNTPTKGSLRELRFRWR